MPTSLALSAIAGWVSVSSWVVVYSPQIIENFQLQSGEGLSVAFIVLWLVGDLTNLAGGVLIGLIPSLVLLAIWYTVCDLILLFQVYYYRRLAASSSSEETPLLASPPKSTGEDAHWLASKTAQFLGAVGLVLGTGLVAWWMTSAGEGHGGGGGGGEGPVEPPLSIIEWKSQTLGWISAVTYIGSRMPQIVHNHKTRCEGLSITMFFFTITGNVTYVASILFKSLDERYVFANLPWLCGAGVTVLLDFIVLGQFVTFARRPQQPLLVAGDEEQD